MNGENEEYFSQNDSDEIKKTVKEKDDEVIKVPKKIFKYVAYGLVLLLLLLGACAVGIRIGSHKERFGRPLMGPDSYLMQRPGYRLPNLPGPMDGMRDLFGGRFKPGQGIVGVITKVEASKIIVKDVSGNEKEVLIDSKTLIKSDGRELKLKDLLVDNKVVAFGPLDDSGRIKAVLIRVLPDSSSLLPEDYFGFPPGPWMERGRE